MLFGERQNFFERYRQRITPEPNERTERYAYVKTLKYILEIKKFTFLKNESILNYCSVIKKSLYSVLIKFFNTMVYSL